MTPWEARAGRDLGFIITGTGMPKLFLSVGPSVARARTSKKYEVAAVSLAIPMGVYDAFAMSQAR